MVYYLWYLLPIHLNYGVWLLKVFLNFSIEIGTCPSLMLGQVNACWDKGGNHLGERSVLNSYLSQLLSELHTSILLLLFYCFTLGQEVNARNMSQAQP